MMDFLQNILQDGTQGITLLPWAFSFFISTSVILGGVWLIERLGLLRSPDLTAFIWRAAVVTALLTALPLKAHWGTIFEVGVPGWSNPELTHSSYNQAIDSNDKRRVFDPTHLTSANQKQLLDEVKVRDLESSAGIIKERTREIHTISAYEGFFDDLDLASGLMILWAIIGGVGLFRLLGGLALASRSAGKRQVLNETSPAWMQLLGLCRKAGIKNIPTLTHSNQFQGPVCMMGNEICLPSWALEELNDKQMSGLLAHELGHLVRRDPQIFILLEMINRVFFFQPLFRLATKRLRVVAELAADAWAADQTRDAKSVARTLFKCAKKISNNKIKTRQPFILREDWEIAMAHDTSTLKQRVEHLVGSSADSFRSVNGKIKIGMTAAMMVAAFGLPQFQLVAATASDDRAAPLAPVLAGSSSVSSVAPVIAGGSMKGDTNFHIRENGKNKFEHSSRNLDIEAEWRGDLIFADDESTIIEITKNGYFELETENGKDKERSIRFENDGGRLVAEYKVDGKEQPLDKEGNAWLKTELVRLLRLSGMNAEDRVTRIMKTGGKKAVFEEFKHLGTDYTKRKYVMAFTEVADLNDKEYSSVVQIIADFGSDYEKRVSVIALIDNEKLNTKRANNLVDVVSTVDSDYETRVILLPLVDKVSFKKGDLNFDVFLKIFEGLDSDYEMRVVLLAFFERDDLKVADIEGILKIAAKNIDSDYEMRVIITALNEQLGDNKKVVLTALNAISSVDSDYERRVILTHIMDNSTLDNGLWAQVLKTVAKIDSEYEKATVLKAALDTMPMTDDLLKAFRASLKTIGGDYEYGKVARALERKLD